MNNENSSTSPSQASPLLRVRNLKTYFPIVKGVLRRTCGYIKAVDDVSFDVLPGECLGIVGESGSGKTTVGRSLLRIIQPTGGTVEFRQNDRYENVLQVPQQRLKHLWKDMQMIFQDPYSSLNPRMTVMDLVGEPLLAHGMKSRKEREQRVRWLLGRVGLNPRHLNRYPHAFSGGQRQRIGIARTLALNPRLIIADEAVSALDVSVQAQVINLLQELQRDLGLTYIFISHDLSVIRHICDNVIVMQHGRIVESGDVEGLFENPRQAYTRSLIDAIPVADPHRRKRLQLSESR